MSNLQTHIENYLKYCEEQKRLDYKTLKAYKIDLSQFCQSISTNNLTDITSSMLENYISELHQKYKPKTVKRKIACIKALFHYFEYREIIDLNPFNKIGLPVHELAMMMTIALRFIPTLLDETDKIMKAQMSRGADFESKNLVSRAKNLVPLLVPLFVSAFRRAEELAMAMEARCYRGGYNRTKMRQSIITKSDYIAGCILIIYLVIIIITRFI